MTLTNGNGAAATPSRAFRARRTTDAAGHCSVTFTSSTPGKVTGHASSTLTSGRSRIRSPCRRTAAAGTGSDAVKTFVDAYITISPPSAANPINTTHTYTAHVFVNNGSGAGYIDAPNGTVVTFAFVGAHVGSFVAGNQCTIGTAAGTCTIDTTSAKPGDDTM